MECPNPSHSSSKSALKMALASKLNKQCHFSSGFHVHYFFKCAKCQKLEKYLTFLMDNCPIGQKATKSGESNAFERNAGGGKFVFE